VRRELRYRSRVPPAVLLLAVLRLTLRLELGLEYDTNANRAEVVSGVVNPDRPTASPLVRTTARLNLQGKKGINLIKAQIGLGAKAFFNPAVLDQSAIVVQGGVEDHLRLWRKAELMLDADYYDAFQNLATSPCSDCFRRRDFRTGTAGGRLTAFDGPGVFWIGLAYRGFQYKPDPYFDFQTPAGDLGASSTWQVGDGTHELSLTATYHLERRSYEGLVQQRANTPDCQPGQPFLDSCLVLGDYGRTDWFHEAGVELSYVGVLFVSLGYALQYDASNSFGQSLLRNIITLKLAYRFPWQIYATLKAQLMVTKYLDPVLLDPTVASQTFLTIEDENRNAVIVDLERAIKKTGVSVNARYSFFTNELGSTPSSFRRQVVYLGLTYRFRAR
jgi:hypothetical protein